MRRYDVAMHYYIFFFLRLLLCLNLSRCCAVLMYDILIYVLKAWTQKQDSSLAYEGGAGGDGLGGVFCGISIIFVYLFTYLHIYTFIR